MYERLKDSDGVMLVVYDRDTTKPTVHALPHSFPTRRSADLCGLKARIALAMQEYAVAADYADKAIAFAEGKKGAKLFSTSQISACPESAIFANITSNGEAVWAAMTQDDQTIYFYSYYANMSWNFNASIIRQAIKCINSKLYDTMSDTDLQIGRASRRERACRELYVRAGLRG